ncbi:MAG: trigger factor [Bacteroidales bacterium]|jgi:trigger factor|nr:trigger factor [Bacteroidales bacterium]
MKVTKEMTANLTAEICIEITANDYQENVSKGLKKLQKEIKMPGFRPGQVPVGMIKKMYEKSVRAEEVQKVLNDSLYNYLDTEKISILGEPLPIDNKNKGINFENTDDYKFYFEIGLQPEFAVDLKSIKPTYYTIEPTDDMLNKFVEDIRHRLGKFENPEEVGATDVVFGEMLVLNTNDDAENAKIKTSFAVDKIADENIKTELIGKKTGENITFNVRNAFTNAVDRASMLRMDNEKADNVQDVQFTISSISRVEVAELNVEFFEKAYPKQDITTEKAFRERAKKDLCDTYAKEADRYFLNDVTRLLIKEINIELPDEFLKRWLSFSAKNEDDRVKIIEDYEKYRDSIKWQMIEREIVKAHNIDITEDEIKNYYKTSLLINYFPVMEGETDEDKKQREASMEKIATNLLENKEQTKQVFDYLYEIKLTQVLKNNITAKQKSINIDDFTKMVMEERESK